MEESHDLLEKKKESEEVGELQSNDVYTVSEAIEVLGIGRYHLKLIFIIGLVWLGDATELVIISLVGEIVRCEWNLSDLQVTMISLLMFGGTILGSVLMGKLSDQYGRRKLMLFFTAFIFFYGALSSVAPNFAFLGIARFMLGFFLSSYFQSCGILLEYMPAKTRSYVVVILQVPFTCGLVYQVLFSGLMIPNTGWRIWLFTSALPYIFIIFAVYKLPESVRYLNVSGNVKEIERLLSLIARANNKSLPDKTLIAEEVEHRGMISVFLKAPYNTQVLKMCALSCCTATFYIALVLMQPVLERTMQHESACAAGGCHNKPFAYYLDIAKSSVFELLSVPLVLALLLSTGRKVVITLSAVCGSIVLVPLLFSCTPVYAFFGVARIFSASLYNTVLLYNSEVFPTTMRGLAIGFQVVSIKISTFGAVILSQLLVTSYPTISLAVLIVINFVCPLFLIGLPETKNKSLKDTH